ncbi:MAG: restriction endonuclease subunit S [Gammaproteobacteria bacterium]|nr:restriction endonuclease subunit S [Gammaproteobacteria bacterium]
MSKQSKKALVPVRRFTEFRDATEWKNKPLEDALSPVVRERKKPVDHYLGLGIRSHGKGTFLKHLKNPEKNAMEYLYEVCADDLIVNITFAWEGAIAIAQQADAGALVSHRFPTFVFKRKVAIPEFFRYVILDKQFIYKLGVISPGGAGRNRVLNKKDFLRLTVSLPELGEQQKIANCLTSVDDLITAQTQKLDALKTHKKGLMQQLFPAEGKTTPQRRFPEFRGAGGWEEKPLEKVATFSKGKGVSKSDISPNGKQPCIRYGELYTHYNETIETVISYTDVPADELVLSEANDVIIPASGETEEDIATASCVLSSGIALGGDLNIIRSNLNGVFLSYYLNNAKKKEIARLAQGISVVHLYSSQLRKLNINVPGLPEQQKIADCLSSLDGLITAQAKKVEALKTHKKGLMQQLFPAMDEVPA